MNPTLLSRDEFREGVFARDGYKCVFCEERAVDAHHIIERRLFPDGGYYLDNGASVCEAHHILCEKTDISVEDVREAAGIKIAVLPPQLYDDQIITKWGDVILPNKMRLRGELFDDDSVQKILKDKLHLYAMYVKYPRTYHLPWSESVGKDDRIIPNLNIFRGKRVVVTEKMDGENTSCYSNGYVHARSIDGRSHISRDWVKNFWASRFFNLDENWRVCGENLYAKHSIKYDQLESLFLGFSIWDANNMCLGWNDTETYFKLLNITSVPVLYDGIFDEKIIKNLWEPSQSDFKEGYVMRLAEKFHYSEFKNSVAKFVRKNHVHTHGHWMRELIIKNNQKIS